MSDTPAPQQNPTDEHKEKYFSFQIKGWTNFDPMDKPLAGLLKALSEARDF
jgi:hypothetical protein